METTTTSENRAALRIRDDVHRRLSIEAAVSRQTMGAIASEAIDKEIERRERQRREEQAVEA